MSGWDVSSTPTWGPQDGPDDAQGYQRRDDASRGFGGQDNGGFSGESQAGGPPPEFFGEGYGQEQGSGAYPQRTPGESLGDLARRESQGRHSSAQDNAYGQGGGYGDGGYGSYGQGGGYGGESGYGSEGNGNGYGQDGSYGQGGGYGHDNGYGQDSGHGQDWAGGTGQGDPWGQGGQDHGSWDRAAGQSAGPWSERGQQEAGYPAQSGQDYGRQDYGQQDFGRDDYQRQAAAPGFPDQDYSGQDYPGDYGDQGYPGQSPNGYARPDHDPALQDFFAPQRGGTGGYAAPGADRSSDSRYRQAADQWDDPGRPRPPRGGTGPRPAPRVPRRDDDDDEPRRIGPRGLIAIGVVIVIVIVGAVILLKGHGSGSPTASNTPTSHATTPAAKPKATKPTGAKTTGGATTTSFTLSTPATAGGYPVGRDPNFLAAATTTAEQITAAVKSGGGGAVTGSPVSAAYQLPLSQVITFVGFKGTFTPAKVATILASLGSDPNAYPAGPNGGMLGCANTTASPSGAVCVWATSSTLGVTEFWDATGPETLTTSQAKGAADTLKLRASVETKK